MTGGSFFFTRSMTTPDLAADVGFASGQAVARRFDGPMPCLTLFVMPREKVYELISIRPNLFQSKRLPASQGRLFAFH